MADDLAAVVMAGGLGTRMKSATPKHLHPLLGRRMVDWVIAAARDAGVTRVVVVASPDSADSYDGLEVAGAGKAARPGDPWGARRPRPQGPPRGRPALERARPRPALRPRVARVAE